MISNENGMVLDGFPIMDKNWENIILYVSCVTEN